MRRTPILTTGASRSGTTWVGKMIGLSPSVHYIGEFFNPENSHLNRGSIRTSFQYVTKEDEPGISQEFSRCLNYNYQPANRKKPSSSYVSRLQLYRISRKVVGLPRPLVKDPQACLSSNWLAQRYDMDVICLIRNPAAYIASVVEVGWYHDYRVFNEIPELKENFLKEFESQLAMAPDNKIQGEAWWWFFIYKVLLDYCDQNPEWQLWRLEDIADQPEKSFQEIYQKLGLDYSKRIRGQISEYSKADNPSAASNEDRHLIRRDSKGSQQRWRTLLSQEDVQTIREITEPIASRFYTDSDW